MKKPLPPENINFNNNDEYAFSRTKFLVSVGYLIIQVIIPAAILFFLTGTDFTFTTKLALWLMIVCTLLLLFTTFLLTLVGYKIKLHYLDQFTYTMPFSFLLGMFYLSGYFLNPTQLLIRFILAIASAIIGIFFTCIILLLVIRNKQMKTYRRD